ncbi:hypothetical protein Godav_013714 [Gossypium davidsonii]|uniref:Uncharacterized protein n=2 Tax=Gossypium TaxID=3633 RepID=A0A7J8RHF0_GOSDV|nr:hypothetical protein [Gossypium davidsonii]MBA0648433.1 hypothetical protein [Gossypium klotzschianum]
MKKETITMDAKLMFLWMRWKKKKDF